MDDVDYLKRSYEVLGKLNDIMFERLNFDYPRNIIDLLKDDIEIFRKIIDFYYGETKIKISYGCSLHQVIEELCFIKAGTTDLKKKFVGFNKITLKWLLDINFFENIFDESEVTIVSKDEVNEYKKNNPIIMDSFIPRINQKDAFERLEKYGIENGIHCQATGCGKSYIILRTINYAHKLLTDKSVRYPKIILFTERVSVLSDLFKFGEDSLKKDNSNIKKWKQLGICDLTKFDIIDRCTIKKKDWVEILKSDVKPILLVINRAYLTSKQEYKELIKNDIQLVLHDECHNTGSTQCFEFLKYCKEIGTKIVGFSATPLRTGKNDVSKLKEIYGNDGALNLLTDYNMIFAISKGLILPPEFYWYEIEKNGGKNKNGSELISQEELGSVLKILDKVCSKLPNKKIVAWCGTIKLAKEWKRLFETCYKQRKNLKDLKFGIDTSEKAENDYDDFKSSDGKYMLFCANKHREGSDIIKLDCCVFLDRVKNRGCIPLIQSIGRALRICILTQDKKKGIIVDGFYRDDINYGREFVKKVIGYYLALQNLTDIDECQAENNYEKYVKLMDVVSLDVKRNIVNFTFGDITIRNVCNKLEWASISKELEGVFQRKIKIGADGVMKHKGRILKEEFGFNKETDFLSAYRQISNEDKIKYNLPDVDSEEYTKMLSGKSWYDLLEIEHNYYNYDEFVEITAKMKKKYKGNWAKMNKKDNRIPIHPEYVYGCRILPQEDIESNI